MSVKSSIGDTSVNLLLDYEDIPIWTPVETGKFSVSSAWKLLRQKRNTSQFEAKIWYKDIPYKMSFTTWRAIHNRLSTDDKILKFGIGIYTNCNCCVDTRMVPALETTEHLFYNGSFAQNIWQVFTEVRHQIQKQHLEKLAV
ncbi:uncharacterized protein LOC132630507 [Lycium barbarum]|uniref:uncharacterized protein LOC132630507 n=1 Tax=Lycium barbarum TaxID=112863 RepID=UPI00293EF23C|nr:uncharacterized protein LOC132630507 [Lycium barbarum]